MAFCGDENGVRELLGDSFGLALKEHVSPLVLGTGR